MISRRSMLAMVAAALMMGGAPLPAMAGKGSGSGNSGRGGSGNSGRGGGGNSGPGGDDDREDDRDDDRDDDDDDQEQASDARKRGRASSLKDVLRLVQRQYKGKVVDVKFANRQNTPTYRIKLIDNEGRLITVSVDARTRRILRTTGL